MNSPVDIVGETGLQFFGKMTASISHEIKNVLAIINESAGLMEDLIAMGEKGLPIATDRLKNQTGKIIKQLQRADGIVKIMNRFAHSVDEALKSVELGETVEFVTALCARSAAMREVALELQRPKDPVTVTTHTFLLENLLWLCLDFAIDSAGPGKAVQLKVETREKGGAIRFSKLQGLARAAANALPGQKGNALLSMLKADLDINIDREEFVLTLTEEGST